MRKLALIPARKGSKRIENKNIKDFAGIPIIGYSIKAALEWKFDKVIVYTDSPKYSKIAKEFGAEVPFRREEVDDTQGLYDVVMEVLRRYKVEKMLEWDFICLIYPCAPFINHELIEAGYNLMLWGNHDCVFPVAKAPYPYQRLMYFEGDRVKYVFPVFRDTPSNDWKDTYTIVGTFFWLKVSSLKHNKTLIPDNSGALVINSWEAIDIDTVDDWEYAEVKYRVLQEMGYNR